MRSRYKILINNDKLYFLTISIVEMIPIFTNSEYMNIIIENFKFYQKNQQLKIYSYVIMDNHLHIITSHKNNLIQKIQNFKSFTAKEILKQLQTDKRKLILNILKQFKKDYKTESSYQLWQEGNFPKQIQNIEMFNQKVEYIHYNPVRRGLVSNELHWVYSSAKNFAGLEVNFEVDKLDD